MTLSNTDPGSKQTRVAVVSRAQVRRLAHQCGLGDIPGRGHALYAFAQAIVDATFKREARFTEAMRIFSQGGQPPYSGSFGVDLEALDDVLDERHPRKVGCEGADGLLRVHLESETCDVCAPHVLGKAPN
jgi:hypothetical protein